MNKTFSKLTFFIIAIIVLVLVNQALPTWAANQGQSSAPNIAAPQAGTVRTFTFVNNSSQTIWVGTLSNSGMATLVNGGFQLNVGQTINVSVPGNWGGRFWGRTDCTFNASGQGTCLTGDCANGLLCNGAGGIPPASLAEFTLFGAGGNDFYDVSLVDGYNVPMTVSPIGKTATAGNPYMCGAPGCTADLNATCPTLLQKKDASGKVIACMSACEAFGLAQYCCAGAYNTPATCNPNTWPKPAGWPASDPWPSSTTFKNACPTAYSYAYDDPTSTFQCSNVGYKITFGASGTTPPPATNTPVAGKTNTPAPTSSGGGGSGNVVYPLTGATTLSFTAGTSAGSDTIASAGGANHDGIPTNQVTYTVSGVNGTYTGGATAYNLYIDAGTSAGDATQARISYDFNGDGVYDRVETYNYFATDPVVGWETYTQGQGLKSSSGSFSNFSNGKIKLEVWNAIGSGSSMLRTSASSSNGQQSSIAIPFSGASGGGSNPTNTATFVPTRTNTPSSGPTATRTNTPVGATATKVPPTATSSGVAAWAPNTAYSIGTLVTYGGHTYKCIQAHTSQTGWEPPNVPALWQLIS